MKSTLAGFCRTSISCTLLAGTLWVQPAGAVIRIEGMVIEKTVMMMRQGARAGVARREINAYSRSVWPDFGVDEGNMTMHGGAALRLWGQYHRQRLERAGQIAPNVPLTQANMYIAASPVTGVQASARAFLEGLSPRSDVSLATENTRPWFLPAHSGLASADPAPAGRAVEDALGMSFERARLHYRQNMLDVEHTMDVGSNRLSGMPWQLEFNARGLRVTPLELLDTMVETARQQYVNNLPMTDVAFGHIREPADLTRLMSVRGLNHDLIRQPRFLAVRQGWPLLSQIFDSLSFGFGRPADPATVAVYVGHGANIAALRSIFGFDWQLPDGLRNDAAPGGMLMFERFREIATHRRFVRVSYHSQTHDQIRHLTPLGADAAFGTELVPSATVNSPGHNLIPWAEFGIIALQAMGEVHAPQNPDGTVTVLGDRLDPGLPSGTQDPHGLSSAALANPMDALPGFPAMRGAPAGTAYRLTPSSGLPSKL